MQYNEWSLTVNRHYHPNNPTLVYTPNFVGPISSHTNTHITILIYHNYIDKLPLQLGMIQSKGSSLRQLTL